MYFQFLIEDESAGLLVKHVMGKLRNQYPGKDILWKIKSFGGIGHLPGNGKPLDRKTGKLLNDLPMYLRAFSKILVNLENAALVIVLDNDKRDIQQFGRELENIAVSNMILCDYVFCVAIKEIEAWLLGDTEAIKEAYPNAKMQYIKNINRMQSVIHGKYWQIWFIRRDSQN